MKTAPQPLCLLSFRRPPLVSLLSDPTCGGHTAGVPLNSERA